MEAPSVPLAGTVGFRPDQVANRTEATHFARRQELMESRPLVDARAERIELKNTIELSEGSSQPVCVVVTDASPTIIGPKVRVQWLADNLVNTFSRDSRNGLAAAAILPDGGFYSSVHSDFRPHKRLDIADEVRYYTYWIGWSVHRWTN